MRTWASRVGQKGMEKNTTTSTVFMVLGIRFWGFGHGDIQLRVRGTLTNLPITATEPWITESP